MIPLVLSTVAVGLVGAILGGLLLEGALVMFGVLIGMIVLDSLTFFVTKNRRGTRSSRSAFHGFVPPSFASTCFHHSICDLRQSHIFPP